MPKYSPRCAGAMLATWASIWRHWPNQSNTELAIAFRDAGAHSADGGGAVGWHDPEHAAAALATLSRQAAEMLHAAGGEGTPLGVGRVVAGCRAALSNTTADEKLAKHPDPNKRGMGRRMATAADYWDL